MHCHVAYTALLPFGMRALHRGRAIVQPHASAWAVQCVRRWVVRFVRQCERGALREPRHAPAGQKLLCLRCGRRQELALIDVAAE